MAKLGAVVCQAIVHHYGRDEFLRRLSHPFWFQSFGAVMGMDWHSSGITTSVIGALKRGLGPLEDELGIHIVGHEEAVQIEVEAILHSGTVDLGHQPARSRQGRSVNPHAISEQS